MFLFMVIFLYDFIGWYTFCKSNLIVYQSIKIVELKYGQLTKITIQYIS
jgi:hypothetical protein